MNEITVVPNPSSAQLEKLGVTSWGIWKKEASTFPWTYDSQEICYFLEGDVIVTPTGSTPVKMGKGDLVTFPAGMTCVWEIKQAVRKHYQFD